MASVHRPLGHAAVTVPRWLLDARDREAARLATVHASCRLNPGVVSRVREALPTSRRGARVWDVQSATHLDRRTVECVLWRLVHQGAARIRGGYDVHPWEWIGLPAASMPPDDQPTLWR